MFQAALNGIYLIIAVLFAVLGRSDVGMLFALIAIAQSLTYIGIEIRETRK